MVDDFNREALANKIDLNIPALRVVRVLDRIVANRGYPLKMRMDNGPELVSLTLAQWAEEHGVMLEFIRPGKPTQNAVQPHVPDRNTGFLSVQNTERSTGNYSTLAG